MFSYHMRIDASYSSEDRNLPENEFPLVTVQLFQMKLSHTVQLLCVYLLVTHPGAEGPLIDFGLY